MSRATIFSAMTIAGSDSGGGAGIQADLKTFAAFGVHGVSAIAALTAQNTLGVHAVHQPPLEFLRAQLDVLFDDFEIRAVKIGMLADAETIRLVADVLRARRPASIVLDPVMIAASGARLLEDRAIEAMVEELLPLATILTPNFDEGLLLLHLTRESNGREIEPRRIIERLRQLGAERVLLKGGNLDEGIDVVDRYLDAEAYEEFRVTRRAYDGHGLGCSLSSAIAALLAHGEDVKTAVKLGLDYLARSFETSYRPGKGPLRVLDHLANIGAR
ncbi:MAG: bifunctional hydroxymethylpyrimidine kinase/phosphomethylpyrimidine kinase [Sandaracinaceae bacterium]|nr:bifunctional hydroxymethylpyrimidine kinase/phosphomethylpyrimidine kinase [Sandaracinaceae bacterium]